MLGSSVRKLPFIILKTVRFLNDRWLTTGNELSGSGVGARIAANQYASDTISLRNLVRNIYGGVEPKPQIIAPGGFFDPAWFKEFLDKTKESLDVITHHIYNLGPGTVPDNFILYPV